MTLFPFILFLFMFIFNIQMVTSFHLGCTFFHTKSTISSIYKSPRIYNLATRTLSFKNNDDNEIRIKKSRVTASTPIHNLIAIDTLEELNDMLNQPNESDVVVVRFYSPWCKVRSFSTHLPGYPMNS